MDSLYRWHKYNPWLGDVSRNVSGLKVKGQGHTVWSFRRVRSITMCLFDEFTSFHTWYDYKTHEWAMCHVPFPSPKVKVTWVILYYFISSLLCQTSMFCQLMVLGRSFSSHSTMTLFGVSSLLLCQTSMLCPLMVFGHCFFRIVMSTNGVWSLLF